MFLCFQLPPLVLLQCQVVHDDADDLCAPLDLFPSIISIACDWAFYATDSPVSLPLRAQLPSC